MKHYKTVAVPATTRQQLTVMTCDCCKNMIVKKDSWSEEGVLVQYKTGNNYPEGGSGDITSVDICPACFKEKLRPWLESQGCKFHTEEWDW